MGTAQRLPRAEREQQLLDVAERLFIEKGYERTSIEDVARAAGVSRPIVYDHHGSKDGLYIACVRRARGKFLERMFERVSEVTDPVQQLRAGADAFFSYIEEDPDRWTVLFGSAAVPLFGKFGEELVEIGFETIAGTTALLRAAAPDADPERLELLAQSIAGAAVQLGRWWTRNRTVPRERVVERYTEFISRGVQDLLPAE